MTEYDPEVTKAIASRPALVEYFGIEGLYGYRSISLTSKFAATVLIAKNGSGKTTLLGAMDAFLKRQFGRLSELDFKRIECRLRGVEETLVLEKNDLDELMEISDSSEVFRAAKLNDIEPSELVHFLIGEYDGLKQNSLELMEHPVFRKIHRQSRHTLPTAKDFFNELEVKLSARSTRLEHLQRLLRNALRDYEIVYLPTYRRIELSLPEEAEEPITGRRSTSIHSRLGLNRRGLHAGDIQFGVTDISHRLEQLNKNMLFESNQGYGEISANIINDLINGSFDRDVPSLEERPTKEALSLFFLRLKQGRKLWRHHPSYSDFEIPDVERIYREESVSENSRKFLTYFLGKLDTVMQKTRDVESAVEEFVNNCNRYLSAPDESVQIPGSALVGGANEDSKVLRLDRQNLAVTVSSLVAKREIPLDALSSGEKQMISLFARLYLYPKRKIVLIDEPELSLSIDWQRKILLDIVNAKQCEQVVAITHSPFVFDNPLEPFATAMRLQIEAAPDSGEEEQGDPIHE